MSAGRSVGPKATFIFRERETSFPENRSAARRNAERVADRPQTDAKIRLKYRDGQVKSGSL
jgi:hypothetical protein